MTRFRHREEQSDVAILTLCPPTNNMLLLIHPVSLNSMLRAQYNYSSKGTRCPQYPASRALCLALQKNGKTYNT